MTKNIFFLKNIITLALLTFCVGMISTCVEASVYYQARKSGEKFSMKIDMNGFVTATGTCSFNQSGTVGISFGIVKYISSNGSNTLDKGYIQPLPASMACTGDSSGSASMKLSSSNGNEVTYQGKKLLPITIDNIGKQSPDIAVRLLVNDQSQDINTSFALNMRNPPTLEAEIVQIGNGASFTNGSSFSANATLTMAFD